MDYKLYKKSRDLSWKIILQEGIKELPVNVSAAEFRWERMKELYKRDKFLTSPLERDVFERFKYFIKKVGELKISFFKGVCFFSDFLYFFLGQILFRKAAVTACTTH